MSFLLVHYATVYHGYSSVLVVEDDMGFRPGFSELVVNATRQLTAWPFKRYVQADPQDLLMPKTLRYYTPKHQWDQVMLSQCPHVECPWAALDDHVCFMPDARPSRCAGAALYSQRGSAKALNVPIRFQSDWQNDEVAKRDATYTGFWTVRILVAEDHSDYSDLRRAQWNANPRRFLRTCLMDKPGEMLLDDAVAHCSC